MRLRLDGLTAHIDWDDPALRLTAAQRAAMALDRELVVTAGAGTGKTHTLASDIKILVYTAKRILDRDFYPKELEAYPRLKPSGTLETVNEPVGVS